MRQTNKRIVTCAITGGIHSPTMSRYLPITPDQIADSAIEAAQAGATVVHIHARDEKTGKPSSELSDYKYIYDKIRNANKDVIVCVTTGGGLGMTVEQRTHYIPHLKPHLASMNCGSMNWGLFPIAEKIKDWTTDWEESYYDNKDIIFPNTFGSIEEIVAMFDTNGVKPELECYDTSHLHNLKFLVDRGVIKGKLYIQFCLGITGGLPATPYSLMMMKDTADRLFGNENYNWSAFGAGKDEYPICTQSLFLGGNVRVGLEDNLYLEKGVLAKSNAELVQKMIHIMSQFGYEPMSSAEAKDVLEITNV